MNANVLFPWARSLTCVPWSSAWERGETPHLRSSDWKRGETPRLRGNTPLACLILSLLLPLAPVPSHSAPPNEPPRSPAPAGLPAAWHAPEPAEVRTRVLAWLDRAVSDAAKKKSAVALWTPSAASPKDLLDRLAKTAALVDPRAQALVDQCTAAFRPGPLPPQAWLADKALDPLVAANLRLYYGRWLIQHGLDDEGVQQLRDLRPSDVVDPAALLFYQAVVQYRQLDRIDGLQTLAQLQAGPAQPQRYRALAQLMAQDLRGLKEDSLDHIARRMDDVRRRLDLGRAGPKVVKVEDGVIESLDKLIKKLEQQQQEQEAAASAGSQQSNKPAQDSMPMGGKGPGEVTRRNIGSKSGWGNISPKEREEAIQQIGRDFPPHYRDVIEQYFRRLASEGQ